MAAAPSKQRTTFARYSAPVFALALTIATDDRCLADRDSSSAAPTIEAAQSAKTAGHYSEAAAMLGALADEGNPQAMVELGYLYANGTGIERNLGEALRLYREAAALGNAAAMNAVGYRYEHGPGCRTKSRGGGCLVSPCCGRWRSNGHEQSGQPLSGRNLALAYRIGRGVKADQAEAFRWYKASADKGNPVGMNSVGFALLNGIGVDKDVAAAVPWLQRAAEFGQPNAMHTLGMLYRDGDGVQANLTTSYEWLSLAVRLYGPGQPQRSEAARQAMLANATQLPAKARAEADQWIAQWKPREHVRPEEQAPPRRSFGPPPRADSI